MLCEICHTRAANVHFTQIVNEEKRELHLCQQCAEEKGFTIPFASLPHLFSGIILNLIAQSHKPQGTTDEDTPRCPSCGLSYADMKAKGHLGCSQCYSTFSDQLKTLLLRIHGSTKHIGTRPPRYRSVDTGLDRDRLERELEEAIANEEYERAARLRDMLRDLSRQSRGK